MKSLVSKSNSCLLHLGTLHQYLFDFFGFSFWRCWLCLPPQSECVVLLIYRLKQILLGIYWFFLGLQLLTQASFCGPDSLGQYCIIELFLNLVLFLVQQDRVLEGVIALGRKALGWFLNWFLAFIIGSRPESTELVGSPLPLPLLLLLFLFLDGLVFFFLEISDHLPNSFKIGLWLPSIESTAPSDPLDLVLLIPLLIDPHIVNLFNRPPWSLSTPAHFKIYCFFLISLIAMVSTCSLN